MPESRLITNERQEREVAGVIDEITLALSSELALKSIVDGLPYEVIEGIRRSLTVERNELINNLAAYKSARNGDVEQLRARAGNDIGSSLIVARIARGWRQKELARRLFLKEQQIQRYEAERYRSISLAGLMRVARALGVQLAANISNPIQEPWLPSFEMSPTEVQKILKHARLHGWFEKTLKSDESGANQLRHTVAEHVGEYGTPSLFRTGVNIQEDHTEDWLILAWKAQVTQVFKRTQLKSQTRYRPLGMTWLKELVHLSSLDDGPIQAKALLAKYGITLIVEPQIIGMKVDGAAFLINDSPIIGMTLRADRIDNFWFTLLHEVAHVVLHYRTGLASGFFDDAESPGLDDLEAEANDFAGNMLIPAEIWKRSAARIAQTAEPIERLAKQLRIAPAIIFGRLRQERQDYSIFSNKIGQGLVRKQLLPARPEVSHEAVY